MTDELTALRAEVAELKELLRQQTYLAVSRGDARDIANEEAVETRKHFHRVNNDLRAEVERLKAEADRMRRDATEEMCDSVRYLFVGMEMPGQTFGGIWRHCESSGMDTSHWPEWMNNRNEEHFNKSARAALVWHCMRHAALAQSTGTDGEKT